MLRLGLIATLLVTCCSLFFVKAQEEERWSVAEKYFSEQGKKLKHELRTFNKMIKGAELSVVPLSPFSTVTIPLAVLSLDYADLWTLPRLPNPRSLLAIFHKPPERATDFCNLDWHTQFSVARICYNILATFEVELFLARQIREARIGVEQKLPKEAARAWAAHLFTAACKEHLPWYMRVAHTQLAARVAHLGEVYDEFLLKAPDKLPPYCMWRYVFEGLLCGEVGAVDFVLAFRRMMTERFSAVEGQETLRKQERRYPMLMALEEAVDTLPLQSLLVTIAPQEALMYAKNPDREPLTANPIAQILNWFADNYTRIEWDGRGRWRLAEKDLRAARSPLREKLLKVLKTYKVERHEDLSASQWRKILAFLKTGNRSVLSSLRK